MAGGLTQARQQAILDGEFAAGDYIAYSENGSSESANLARTAIGAWDAATAATPSHKKNTNALLSAGATGGGTFTHYSVFSAASNGTQRLDWTALTTPRTLAIGEKLSWDAGAIDVTLD